ncbi:MAG: EAL domain-containing protein [Actinobacteria bacterium]|nr:EAL domain-containing protein [Actinomycetota bacterium]
MATLGFVLIAVTSDALREQSTRTAAAAARDMMVEVVRPLEVRDLRAGTLDATDRANVDAAVERFADRTVEVRLWTTSGSLAYSTADSPEPTVPDRALFDQAVADGRSRTRATTDEHTEPDGSTTDRPALDVYVPVHARDIESSARSGTDPVVAVAQIRLDDTATDAGVAGAVRKVTAAVVLGLLTLWVVLLRTVHATSRRLRAVARENARLAHLDSLTGLPNRRMLADRTRHAIERARRDGTRVGLVLLDIDRFKDINDTLGHDRGDQLLEQVAERLRAALRDDDLVARLGGDEFAILLPAVASVDSAQRRAEQVRTLFAPPFELGELVLHVEPSIGVACLPDHADDASALMRTADVAMYRAKHSRTGVAVYSTQTDESSAVRLQLLGELHQALRESRQDELQMYYQPKVDLSTGRTVGFESLMRWHHPERGILTPDQFVPLAEQSGVIRELTRHALASCVAQLAAWWDVGWYVPIAVNLSAHDVTSETIVDEIAALLSRFDVPARLLEVEITETALVFEPARIVPVLTRLGRLGVQVAIDDFGIGSTSISQLRNLPVDILKIDRLFVRDLTEPGREAPEVIVQAMVELAHSFGLTVVAEGVEDERTAVLLAQLGADQAQGYFYARPLPADRLEPPHAAGSARPAGLTGPFRS